MAGTLYLVPTPIGNLGDVSRRAAEVLGAVDLIAAEDTRVTLKLLNHLGLKKPLVSATTPTWRGSSFWSGSWPGRMWPWSPTRALPLSPTPGRLWWLCAPGMGWW